MKRSTLRGILGLALSATLLAAYLAPPQAGETVVLSERALASGVPAAKMSAPSTSPSARDAAALATDVLSIKARDLDTQDDDATSVFASRPGPALSVKATQPAAVPVPPGVAQAPPLPLRVLGRFSEGDEAGVFLQINDQNLVVRVGDTIAEHYKVESLNGTTLTLRYGPLNQVQTLDVGGSN